MLPTINQNNNKILYKRQAKALYQYIMIDLETLFAMTIQQLLLGKRVLCNAWMTTYIVLKLEGYFHVKIIFSANMITFVVMI